MALGVLLLLLVLPALVDGQTCKSCAAGEVTVDSATGAYKDILVVVDKDVSYDSQLIPNIMDYFQSASDALFEATKHVSGRYFGEVTILLPLHWPEVNITAATTESSDRATFSIEPDNSEWGSNPHTIRVVGDCGSPGKVTVLPETFTNDRSEAEKYGSNIGKTIVHEWAHLRYGLFDESSSEDGSDQLPCDAYQDTSVIPRCSSAIEGDLEAGEESGSCVFVPRENQTAGASLLYAPYIDSVFTFCDDAAEDSGLIHNPYAINEQNSRCDMRSGWSVLRDHKDFAPNIVGATVAQPVQFRIVKDNTLRISIVMDVSGSMAGERLQWMQQSVENFLYSLLHASKMNEETVLVGMTQFSTLGTVLHQLVALNDTTIDSLVGVIPPTAVGGTSIGAGIRKGLEVLQEKGKRSLLLVFTDGEENTAPYINEVKGEVCDYNATVYGIIVSNVANNHPLVILGQETCGGSCVYDDMASTTIYDCLWDAMKSRVPQIAPIEIAADVQTITKSSNWTNVVNVDSVFTSNVMFRFEWSITTGCEQQTVDLITPDGILIDYTSANYTMSTSKTSIEIRAASEQVGDWTYTINNPSSASCSVRYTVEGYSSGVKEAPLISVDMSKSNLVLSTSNSMQANSLAIYVKVTKGTTPVTGATVKAILTNQNNKEWTLILIDNGAGADVRKNDGIYSRYFTEFDANGAYSVRAEVVGEKGKVNLHKAKRSYGSGSPPLPAYRVAMTSSSEPTEAFQRSSVGGLVQINGYSAATSPASLYTPEKIRDLQTAVLNIANRTLSIMWTAVGAYLDQGSASSYDVRISSNATLLLTVFSEAYPVSNDILLNGSLTSPKVAGELERLVIFLSNTNFTTLQQQYYVAVVAVNANNKMSQVSNVASFLFNSPAQPTTTTTTTTTIRPISGGSTFQRWATAAIVIGCLAVYETIM